MKISIRSWILLLFFTGLAIFPNGIKAQDKASQKLSTLSYDNPQQYILGGIDVTGNSYLDRSVVIMLSDLEIGKQIKVPGDAITTAIRKLWDQGLFDDVRISATKLEGDTIYLNLYLSEKPRLNKYSFSGVKKSAQDDIKDKINLSKGDVVTDHLINRTANIIKNHFRDKAT